MKRFLPVYVIVGLISFFPETVLGQDTGTPDYYPLKIGNTWYYKGSKNESRLKVAKQEKIAGVSCYLLEMTVGDNVFTEHVAPQKDGVYRYAIGGKLLEPPLCFLKLALKMGSTWKAASKFDGKKVNIEYTVGEEVIEVPFGKLKTAFTKTNEYEADNKKVRFTIWYAKGIGMAKMLINIDDKPYVLELARFEPGK